MISKLLKAVAVAALALSASVASALPITGQLDFTGMGTFTPNGTGGISEVNFESAYVVGADGDFSGIGLLTNVTLIDPWTVAAPTVNLWSVGGFSFTLEAITENIGGILRGYGTISAAGFDDTFGEWSLTTQGTQGRFSFSSTTVPEPGTVALLGLGLVGLGVSRRRAR